VTLYSINPATEQEIARFEEDSPSQLESKIAAAAAAFRSWRRTTFDERSTLMRRAAEHIRANRERLSRTLVDEMGKPIVQARREVDRFAGRCDYFAEHTAAMLSPEHVPISGLDSWIRFEPLGVALGIMPWNFPFGQASRWAVPALMAGNTALLKHASNVTLAARAIQEVFDSAGFPPGVFTPLFVAGNGVAPIIADPRVAVVSLTGSAAAGEQVGAAAGRAVKKVVLELGGSDPFIVLADADIAAAAEAAARGRFGNNSGQACTASKRFIVVAEVAEAFIDHFVQETRKLRTGDPADEATDVGPLAKADSLVELTGQYEATLAAGARVAYRADLDERTGYFFPPTLLADVSSDMVAAQEETFGPLAAIVSVKDEATAIEVANSSAYGLGCSIWTTDVDRGTMLAGDLEAGMVAINSLVVADPRLPFGGVKRSGYGREMSVHGVRELTNIKAVNVGSADSPRFSR
jgi:succinate-semialdehyde dehydrogenase/glutarate-semialdehyde dehydrogenase